MNAAERRCGKMKLGIAFGIASLRVNQKSSLLWFDSAFIRVHLRRKKLLPSSEHG
jgi:hypothetical protein